jgi:hypothetical protein
VPADTTTAPTPQLDKSPRAGRAAKDAIMDRAERPPSYAGERAVTHAPLTNRDARAAHKPLLFLHALSQAQRNSETPIPPQPSHEQLDRPLKEFRGTYPPQRCRCPATVRFAGD